MEREEPSILLMMAGKIFGRDGVPDVAFEQTHFVHILPLLLRLQIPASFVVGGMACSHLPPPA